MKIIECRDRKKNVTEVLVSDCDYERANKIKWYVDSRGYVVHSLLGGHKLLLHRFIMGERDDMEVDHINHDKLDNRRENLRFVTHQQNSRNRRKPQRANTSSQYKGVSRGSSKKNPWRAVIIVDGEYIYLGSFPTQFRAAQAYDRAALAYHGAHACPNFPANTYISSVVPLETYINELINDVIA